MTNVSMWNLIRGTEILNLLLWKKNVKSYKKFLKICITKNEILKYVKLTDHILMRATVWQIMKLWSSIYRKRKCWKLLWKIREITSKETEVSESISGGIYTFRTNVCFLVCDCYNFGGWIGPDWRETFSVT